MSASGCVRRVPGARSAALLVVAAAALVLLVTSGCGGSSADIPAMKPDLAGLGVDGLRWTKQEDQSDRCSQDIDTDVQPYYMRIYELDPAADFDAVVEQIDRHFEQRGYRSGYPGGGSKGTVSYRVTKTNSDTVEIWLTADC